MKIKIFVNIWVMRQKKVSNNFSWESYGKNVIQTYQNLLTKT